MNKFVLLLIAGIFSMQLVFANAESKDDESSTGRDHHYQTQSPFKKAGL